MFKFKFRCYMFAETQWVFLWSSWIECPKKDIFIAASLAWPTLTKHTLEVDSTKLGSGPVMTISHMPMEVSEFHIHILVPHVKRGKKAAFNLIFWGWKKITETFPLCDDAGIFDLHYSKFTVRLLSLFWESKPFLLFLRKWKNTFIDYVLTSRLDGFNFF